MHCDLVQAPEKLPVYHTFASFRAAPRSLNRRIAGRLHGTFTQPAQH